MYDYSGILVSIVNFHKCKKETLLMKKLQGGTIFLPKVRKHIVYAKMQ